ncbi:MAG TPA: integrase family protein [Oculatellaceae cyanobacterium]
MPKITAKFIESGITFPTTGQLIIRDDELKGFGLRVTKGRVAFVAERRVNGRFKRITIGHYKAMTADEARRQARQILMGTTKLKAVLPKQSAITLNHVFQKFMAVRRLRPNTVRTYTLTTKRCIGDWLSLPVTAITRDMILERHQALTRVTKRGTSGQAQANIAMRILRTVLNFAASNFETADQQPIISINPVSTLSKNRCWHRERRRRVIVPDHKLGEWYRAVMSLRQIYIRDYLLLLILTGLRRTEASTLRWSDIDFSARTITIRAEIAKNKQEHCIPLTDFLLLLLRHRKENSRSDTAYVFPGRRGGPLVEPKLGVSKVVERSGCSFVLHDLRRTYISMAAKLGIPHHVIKKLVNHIASSDVTDGYVIIQVDQLREPITQINNRFLTLFGCSLADWEKNNKTVGQWVVGRRRQNAEQL